MDVLHFILNKGKCEKCGKIVKAKIPKEHQTGYGPRLSALIAEMSGIEGNSRETVCTFCKSVLNKFTAEIRFRGIRTSNA